MKSRKAVADAIRKKLNFTVVAPLRDQLLAHALREQEREHKAPEREHKALESGHIN